jgi:hypothetical protein
LKAPVKMLLRLSGMDLVTFIPHNCRAPADEASTIVAQWENSCRSDLAVPPLSRAVLHAQACMLLHTEIRDEPGIRRKENFALYGWVAQIGGRHCRSIEKFSLHDSTNDYFTQFVFVLRHFGACDAATQKVTKCAAGCRRSRVVLSARSELTHVRPQKEKRARINICDTYS